MKLNNYSYCMIKFRRKFNEFALVHKCLMILTVTAYVLMSDQATLYPGS